MTLDQLAKSVDAVAYMNFLGMQILFNPVIFCCKLSFVPKPPKGENVV